VNTRPAYVSVIDPIGPAIDRTRTILFRPFDLAKWFVIGFSAWLAQLGSGGSGGGNGGGGGGGGPHRGGNVAGELRNAFYQAKDYVVGNLDWIVPVAVVVSLFLVFLWLLVVWLSSRARFSFLYCVAQNKGEFWNPWRQYEVHGFSLSVFRIVLGLLSFVVAMTFLGLGGVLVYFSVESVGFNLLSISGIVMCGLLFVASLIIFGVAGLFTTEFVVPIMYRSGLKCTRAWRVLLDLISDNMGRFVLYLLFQIVIGLALGVIVMGAGCITCGCACCCGMIPYLGAVVFLPLTVFARSYSLYYLAQYGPEFDVIAPEPEPEAVPPAGALQV